MSVTSMVYFSFVVVESPFQFSTGSFSFYELKTAARHLLLPSTFGGGIFSMLFRADR